MSRHRVTRVRDEEGIVDDEYEYRGHRIRRHNDVTPGYWGRWSVGWGKFSRGFETRRQCVEFVDDKLGSGS